MSRRPKTLWAAAVLSLALVGGCASDDDGWEGAEAPPSGEWRWVGEGEPETFGASAAICRRNLRETDPSLGINQRRQAQGTASRPNLATRPYDRRLYWACLEARGWQHVDRIRGS